MIPMNKYDTYLLCIHAYVYKVASHCLRVLQVSSADGVHFCTTWSHCQLHFSLLWLFAVWFFSVCPLLAFLLSMTILWVNLPSRDCGNMPSGSLILAVLSFRPSKAGSHTVEPAWLPLRYDDSEMEFFCVSSWTGVTSSSTKACQNDLSLPRTASLFIGQHGLYLESFDFPCPARELWLELLGLEVGQTKERQTKLRQNMVWLNCWALVRKRTQH